MEFICSCEYFFFSRYVRRRLSRWWNSFDSIFTSVAYLKILRFSEIYQHRQKKFNTFCFSHVHSILLLTHIKAIDALRWWFNLIKKNYLTSYIINIILYYRTNLLIVPEILHNNLEWVGIIYIRLFWKFLNLRLLLGWVDRLR